MRWSGVGVQPSRVGALRERIDPDVSVSQSNRRVTSPRQLAEARRVAARLHRGLADDIRRLREDAAVSRSQLATAAGVDLSFLCRLEEARERPSIETYTKLSLALGADLNTRLYPNTGPAIRDRHQARILEALMGHVDARWRVYPEVAVRRPSRGWIDALLHDPSRGVVIADGDPVGSPSA